jgi:choline dehydrogenase-like flavoprotein
LEATLPRQISLQFLVEQLPEPTNRITIDPAYVDQLGNYLPVLHYNIGDYTMAGFAAARQLSQRIFARTGVADNSSYDQSDQGYFEYEGHGYGYWAAGHYAGSHRMGSSRLDSVVNPRQQTWDHENLYLVGAGNFCTIGTPNPTLTLSALAMMASDNILHDLR